MLNLIINDLNDAVGSLWDDARGFAFHTGKAGGIAGAVGVEGIHLESLCEEISDAYERLDLTAGHSDSSNGFNPEGSPDVSDYIAQREGIFGGIISRLKESPNADTFLEDKSLACGGWEEYGVALNEAVQAKAHGDSLRYALMIGFVCGLMFRDPGPRYPGGSILQAIEEGYQHDKVERLQWAHERLAAAHRLSEPSPFMSKDDYDRYIEAKVQNMRWVQNFGLHAARAGDETVSVPNSMLINHVLRQQSQ